MKKLLDWLKAPFMSMDGKMDYRLAFIMFILGLMCAIAIWVLVQL